MANHLLTIDHLKKDYTVGEVTFPALKNVTLTLGQGKFIVVIGPSGCGKTTLLNLIGGIDRPTIGLIKVNDKEITNLSENELTEYRKDKIGFIFQFYNLIPALTAVENIEMAARLKFPKDSFERSLNILKKVGMEDKANKYPSQLSGGEQQRVAIARALVKEPNIVLADEPTGNLDRETGRKIIELMLTICRERHTTFIVVTHDLTITEVADEIIRLEDGIVLEKTEKS